MIKDKITQMTRRVILNGVKNLTAEKCHSDPPSCFRQKAGGEESPRSLRLFCDFCGYPNTVRAIWLILFNLIFVSFIRGQDVKTEVDKSTAAPVTEETVKDTMIYPENTIEINVYEEPDLSLVTRVSPEGMITYPLLGQLKVGGLTVSELEKKLTQALSDGYLVNPQVRVSVKEFSKITILGQIVKPGMYDLIGKLSVTEAIALAGGLTSLADANRIKVIRIENDGKEKAILVRVKDILKKGDKSRDVILQPKDMIIVPKTRF